MIVVKEVKRNYETKKAEISAFADTKEEVDAGGEFVGMPEGFDIEVGSDLMTASGELAFMKSNGEWNWV